MTTTENEYWLHVCPLCGRIEVYSRDGEGRECRNTVKDKNEGVGVDCQGKWVTSKLTPEEDIYDEAGSPSKAIENRGSYDDSAQASWDLEEDLI